MRTYSITFKDGLTLEGFKWSIFGYYYKDFPDSGFSHNQFNCIRYTREAIQELDLQLTAE